MLSLLGFATILVFLALIITKRLSVITALVLVPVGFGLLGGFGIGALADMMLAGIKQVAPTGILLIFAVLYFSVMPDVGLFNPVVALIIRYVKGDPLKVVMGYPEFGCHPPFQSQHSGHPRRHCLGIAGRLLAGKKRAYLPGDCGPGLRPPGRAQCGMDAHGKSLSYALLEMEIER